MQDSDSDRLTILTTSHYFIQMQRSATISEANGRSAMYLTAVSMTLVALGFIGQAGRFDGPFFAFLFAALSVLVLIGLSTFYRLVQLGAEESVMAIAAERLRQSYLDASPGVEQWIGQPLDPRDPGEAIVGASRLPFQLLLTASSMVAIVTAALIGAGTAVALHATSDFNLRGAVGAGVAAFVAALALQLVSSRRLWSRATDPRQRMDQRQASR